MDLTGAVAVSGAVAVLISAFTGYGGWLLARRAQTTADQRDEELQRAPYLQQLQDWSARLLKEEADRRTQDRAECEERLAAERADCQRRLARIEAEHERAFRDQEAQWGARLLVAERREQAWRRRAEGINGDLPP
jgi:DNA anti-recombination protein RmuC